MLDRKNLEGMVRALKEGGVLWYAPDYDYGPTSSVFAPLFVIEWTTTTTGTWMPAEMPGATIVPFVPRREPNDMGYGLISLTPERTPPLTSTEAAAAWMNRVIEQCILMTPEQYMWLHQRSKTCPEGVPPRY